MGMQAQDVSSITSKLARATPLPPDFYLPDPREVARALLGKILVRRERRQLLAASIVETEAYLGQDDPAAHAAAGRTARNYVLFGPPGRAYVYLAYGNHWCLNVSTLPAGEAGGVLFRALEPLTGLEEMIRARQLDSAPSCSNRSPSDDTLKGARNLPPRILRLLTSGPGRLAQALGVTRLRDNDKDLTDPSSDLFIVDLGFSPRRILATPRIGLTKAVEHPLRYLIAGNAFVSGKKVHA
jgi:DNA-3-methyladenine glycosylase